MVHWGGGPGSQAPDRATPGATNPMGRSSCRSNLNGQGRGSAVAPKAPYRDGPTKLTGLKSNSRELQTLF